MANSTSQEGRVLLAIEAFQRNRFSSIRSAAVAFDVPRTTLSRRFRGTPPQRAPHHPQRKLGPEKEEVLIQWIKTRIQRGTPPRLSHIRDVANILASGRDQQPVGVNWVERFLKRHEELTTRYLRRYNYVRAQCEDPQRITCWFQLVQDTIQEYGILTEDIYNFDETGFAMGIIATAKVVTEIGAKGRPRHIQPGNREWRLLSKQSVQEATAFRLW